MPYELYYLADNQVIFQRVIGAYSLEEVRAAALEMVAFSDSVEGDIFILGDMTKAKSTPIHLAAIREAMNPMLTNPHIKAIAAYGATDLAIINFLMTVLSNLFKVPFKLFKNEESAMGYLMEEAPQLSPALTEDLKRLRA